MACGQVAVTTPSDPVSMEALVVEVQYRPVNVQNTPISLTALPADRIALQNAVTISDIPAMAPNVQLRRAPAAYGNTLQAFVRGIGQLDFNYAFEPGVGIYIDDVYHSTAFGGVFDLLDLEQIEVLRGPQGTLFGKNSIGGAVRLVSRKPRGDNHGYLQASTGSDQLVDFSGAIDLSLVPGQLALRISASSRQQNGYQDRIDFAADRPALAGSLPSDPGADNRSDHRLGTFGGTNVQAWRAALLWTPNERLTVHIVGDHLNDDSENAANKLIAISDGTALNTEPGSTNGLPPNLLGWNTRENLPQFGIPFDARFLDDDPFRTYATYFDPLRGRGQILHSTVESDGISSTIDLQFSPELKLKWISAHRDYQGQFAHDPDQSPLVLENVQNDLGNRQTSHEIRLSGHSLDDQLFFTVGAFAIDTRNTLRGLVQIPPIPAPILDGVLGFFQNDRIETKNRSVFAHGEYDLTSATRFTAGLRYTDESKRYFFDHAPFLIVDEPRGAPFDRVDYRVGLQHQFNRNAMAYASIATGFRSGGVNPAIHEQPAHSFWSRGHRFLRSGRQA